MALEDRVATEAPASEMATLGCLQRALVLASIRAAPSQANDTAVGLARCTGAERDPGVCSATEGWTGCGVVETVGQEVGSAFSI